MELNTAQRRSKTLLAKNLISEIILSLLSSAIYIKAVRYTRKNSSNLPLTI
jgi:hypothetical protein